MDQDSNMNNFAKSVFNYLWFADVLVSEAADTLIVPDISDEDAIEFVLETAKVVVVLSAITVPAFNETVENYFRRHVINRRNFFTFITNYCVTYHTEADDIFGVVLDTLAFVYRLVSFCLGMGHTEFVDFSPMCWMEIFELDLRKGFYARGGWNEFRTYVAEYRYLAGDDTDQTAVAAFLKEINYLFSELSTELSDSQPGSRISYESVANSGTSSDEGLDKLQTNGEAVGFSFGTVDLITSNIPGFEGENKAVVFEFDNSNAKIVKPSKKSKRKPRGKSSLNPVIDINAIDVESQACPSVQNTGLDPYLIERNS